MLRMEVGPSPGDFVLDVDPALSSFPKGGGPPVFGPCLLWPNGWMDQYMTLGMELGFGAGHRATMW